MFNFEIINQDKKTRTGIFHTPHGNLLTPNLAFVATVGEIKGIPKNIISQLPMQLIITNTFHLWVKKIVPYLHLRGVTNTSATIHDYANFKKPIMSDSGGFQVFSLGFGKSHQVGKIGGMFPEERLKINDRNWKIDLEGKNLKDLNNPLKISEQGVEFTYNDQKLLLTPELSMDIQQQIGADIIFAFDECTSPLNSYEYTKEAMERTHRWIKRCMKVWKVGMETGISLPNPSSRHHPQQALFAIVQGGFYEKLRIKSAKYMSKLDVSGYGIGGSLGKTKDDVWKVLEWTNTYLPVEKPRHLLGIGQVRDIFESVERGVDLFDCVIPTREARHKVLYTKHGKVQLRKMKHLDEIIEKDCQCLGCQEKITYKQLYEFFLKKDKRAFIYATAHNIQFFSDLMQEIHEAIELNKFIELKKNYFKYY